MFRVIVVIRRKEGMSREEFLRHWTQEHPAFVRRLPGLRGYRQSPAIEHRKEWPYDGMAELFFDSVAAVARAFDGVPAAELFAHEDDFLEDVTWFIADEPVDVPVTAVPGAVNGV
ncbi:uncharacterized protein (TIGR02118 family) [Microbacterium sp. W4I4]|uniref:EthD family reductase n=1 Tax=Microbacterium sp. W4I4 TaxID=3042295 RepID=UPI00278487E3|nr:EthD family reductase [Microbacterium sp. W4I4]MDQ0615168.1 uncharacterized protein (TIGR02118 family) [Microbacterium sp. W4I4]